MRSLVLAALLAGYAQHPNDYTIYSSVLDGALGEAISHDGGKSQHFVVRDSTASKGLVTAGLKTEFMRRQFGFFSSAYESTVEDFLARNQSSVKLAEKPFEASGRVDVVSRKELPSEDNPEKYWEDYYRKFPRARGLIAFSRPGFDVDRKYALVYFHVACGNLCGERGYALLRFIGGRWIVVRRVVTMMS
jgi:hypothetical protein